MVNNKTGLEWQCSHCGRIYSSNEFFNLEKSLINKKNPENGRVMICKCGKPFHIGKWQLKDKIKIYVFPLISWMFPTIVISTVHLELNHFGFWYETVLFFDRKLFSFIKPNIEFSDRYKTKEEAIAGHKKIVKLIKAHKFFK